MPSSTLNPGPGDCGSNPGALPAAEGSHRRIAAETPPLIGCLKRSHSLAASDGEVGGWPTQADVRMRCPCRGIFISYADDRPKSGFGT